MIFIKHHHADRCSENQRERAEFFFQHKYL